MTTPHGPPVPPSAPHAGVTSPRAPHVGRLPSGTPMPPSNWPITHPHHAPRGVPRPGDPREITCSAFRPGATLPPPRAARRPAPAPDPLYPSRSSAPAPRQLATALPVTSPRPLSGPRRAPDGPGSGARRLGSCPRREGCPRIIGAVEELTQPGHPRMAQPVNPSRPYNPQHSPPDPPGQVSQSASPGPSGPVHLYTDSPTPVAG